MMNDRNKIGLHIYVGSTLIGFGLFQSYDIFFVRIGLRNSEVSLYAGRL